MKLERLGPYKLEKVLGRGGMGAVYAAHNVETGERAAVKVLNPMLAEDATFRERFKLEVETLKKLLHPNIVQLFAFGEQDDHLFYVMELVAGRSLQDELIAGRRFQWREVARIGIEVAQALKHAHDRGVIHRDLKPANLLIDQHEHVKLTDFGIAKLYGGASFTADGGVLGTADYMAPEQAEGKPVTSRCDLYSLGSVLFALLAGRPPFAGKSLPEVIQGLRFEKPPLLGRLNPDVPEEFENIINQLLEKDPQKRIPTAVAVANRLKAMVHALSMETRIDLPVDMDDLPADRPSKQASSVAPSPAPDATMPVNLRPTMPLPPAAERAQVVMRSDEPRHSKQPAEGQAAMTIARGATRSSHPSEDSAEPRVAVEPPARRSVFTAVSKDELGAHRTIQGDEEHPLTAWLKIGGLLATVVLLLAAFYYYATRQPNADSLYQRIRAAAGQGSQALDDASDEVDKFLAIFPADPRSREVQELQDEIERNRLQRQMKRSLKFSSFQPTTPIEHAYARALRLRETDPQAALAQFEALVDAFAGSQSTGSSAAESNDEQCLVLARQQVQELRELVAERIAAEKKLILERLAAADELEATNAAAAAKIRRGIIALYSDRPWASELLAEARARLTKGSDNP